MFISIKGCGILRPLENYPFYFKALSVGMWRSLVACLHGVQWSEVQILCPDQFLLTSLNVNPMPRFVITYEHFQE